MNAFRSVRNAQMRVMLHFDGCDCRICRSGQPLTTLGSPLSLKKRDSEGWIEHYKAEQPQEVSHEETQG